MFVEDSSSNMVPLCEIHADIYSSCVSYMSIDMVLDKLKTDAGFRTKMNEAEASKCANVVPFFREDVEQVQGSTIEVIERATCMSVAEYTAAMDGVPTRVRQTEHPPYMYVPTRGSQVDYEKVYLFAYDPTLPFREVVFRTQVGTVKRCRVLAAGRHLYSSQGDDTLGWSTRLQARDSRTAALDITLKSVDAHRAMLGLPAKYGTMTRAKNYTDAADDGSLDADDEDTKAEIFEKR